MIVKTGRKIVDMLKAIKAGEETGPKGQLESWKESRGVLGMSRGRYELRIGVGDPLGRKSGLWRLFTASPPKSDVYLAPRGAIRSVKASLHESGVWQVSFTPTFVRERRDEGNWFRESRHLVRWGKFQATDGNVTVALRIIIPDSELREFASEVGDSKRVEWVSAPPSGLAREIVLLFTGPETAVSDWPRKEGVETSLLAKHVLPNGDVLWLVHSSGDFAELTARNVNLIRESLASGGADYAAVDLSKPQPSWRCFGTGDVPDGSKYMIELAADTVLRRS